jgi:hypothetical protein
MAVDPESLAEVLASIRELVSAETKARVGENSHVLMLTPDMRTSVPVRSGEVLSEGLDGAMRSPAAPILDEEALRGVINAIVREELQGELGDRINRNLRKLIRRELADMMAERDKQ